MESLLHDLPAFGQDELAAFGRERLVHVLRELEDVDAVAAQKTRRRQNQLERFCRLFSEKRTMLLRIDMFELKL